MSGQYSALHPTLQHITLYTIARYTLHYSTLQITLQHITDYAIAHYTLHSSTLHITLQHITHYTLHSSTLHQPTHQCNKLKYRGDHQAAYQRHKDPSSRAYTYSPRREIGGDIPPSPQHPLIASPAMAIQWGAYLYLPPTSHSGDPTYTFLLHDTTVGSLPTPPRHNCGEPT